MDTDVYVDIMENLLDSIEAWLEAIDGTNEARHSFDLLLADVDSAVAARKAYYSR